MIHLLPSPKLPKLGSGTAKEKILCFAALCWNSQQSNAIDRSKQLSKWPLIGCIVSSSMFGAGKLPYKRSLELQDADSTDIYQISRVWKDLVKRARSKQLAPDEYNSGNFTISNLGMFGADTFDAILPPGTQRSHSTIWSASAAWFACTAYHGPWSYPQILYPTMMPCMIYLH